MELMMKNYPNQYLQFVWNKCEDYKMSSSFQWDSIFGLIYFY